MSVDETRSLVPDEGAPELTALDIIRPLADSAAIVANWEAFQKLKHELLTQDDYQEIQGRPRIKKSGWRKIAAAFGISDQIVREVRVEYPGPTGTLYFVWEVVARAIAPNGRYADGVGSCASNERRFTHLDHDVRSTAHTRSKNRAIADLVGGGEVSAEEMGEIAPAASQDGTRPAPQSVARQDGGDGLICETCGAKLEEIRFRDGTAWLPLQLASLGRRKHGRVLCMDHYRQANDARRRAEQGPGNVAFSEPSPETPAAPATAEPEAEYVPLNDDQITVVLDKIQEQTGAAASEVTLLLHQPLGAFLAGKQRSGNEFIKQWKAWKQKGVPIPGAPPALQRDLAAGLATNPGAGG